MKKVHILSLMSTMLLSSCSGLNPVGTYQFRLGKTDGSHLEITAELTDQDHERVQGSKKMTLTADLGEEMSPQAILESYGSRYPILAPFISIIETEMAKIKGIPMYYNVLDIADDKYGNRLAIGTDVVTEYVDALKKDYPAIEDLLKALGIKDEDLIITPEKTQYIFNAYINAKNLTIQIPVSVDDLTMQMFWYGKSDLIKYDYVASLPGKQGSERFGTHPVVKKDDNEKIIQDDILTVNNLFEKEFSNTFLYQEDDKIIGSFVTSKVDDKTQLKLYLDDSYTGSHNSIEAHIKTKSLLGEYEVDKDIKLSVDDSHLTNVTHNGKTGKEEGFIDENNNEFVFNDFIQAPFVFRDYHVVNVGLTKI